jgi:hypothetical protein
MATEIITCTCGHTVQLERSHNGSRSSRNLRDWEQKCLEVMKGTATEAGKCATLERILAHPS